MRLVTMDFNEMSRPLSGILQLEGSLIPARICIVDSLSESLRYNKQIEQRGSCDVFKPDFPISTISLAVFTVKFCY